MVAHRCSRRRGVGAHERTPFRAAGSPAVPLESWPPSAAAGSARVPWCLMPSPRDDHSPSRGSHRAPGRAPRNRKALMERTVLRARTAAPRCSSKHKTMDQSNRPAHDKQRTSGDQQCQAVRCRPATHLDPYSTRWRARWARRVFHNQHSRTRPKVLAA